MAFSLGHNGVEDMTKQKDKKCIHTWMTGEESGCVKRQKVGTLSWIIALQQVTTRNDSNSPSLPLSGERNAG